MKSEMIAVHIHTRDIRQKDTISSDELTYVLIKVRNGSRVGQVERVELGGQVRDLDPSLLNSRNLSWVGQVRQVVFGGRVNDLDPSAPFCEP